MASPDDLTTEHPEMVAVFAQGLVGQSLARQFMQKGLEEFDYALPDDDIAVEGLP